MKVKTVLFDVCGVLGDARGKVPWKAKVAMEEAKLSEKYGIGLIEILNAYSTGGFDSLWRKYKVRSPDIALYFRAWDGIPEYPVGSVRIYSEVPFVFNKLLKAGIDIAICTRLTNQNVANVLREIKKRGFEGQIERDIRVFNPQSDEIRKDDGKFVEKILYEAYNKTESPMVYVDDGLERAVHFRTWNSDLFIIGSTRGFYSVRDLQTTYYKKVNGSVVFEKFESESDANKDSYSKLFNTVINNLEELDKIIDIK